MEIFDLIVDEKITTWRRSYITVEAETLDQAVSMCAESGADCATDTIDSTYIYECEECVSPEQNNGFATVEVMDRHFNILRTNEPTISR